MLILTCECGVRRFVDCRSGHRPMLHRGRRTGENVNLMRYHVTTGEGRLNGGACPRLRPVQIADTRARPNPKTESRHAENLILNNCTKRKTKSAHGKRRRGPERRLRF